MCMCGGIFMLPHRNNFLMISGLKLGSKGQLCFCLAAVERLMLLSNLGLCGPCCALCTGLRLGPEKCVAACPWVQVTSVAFHTHYSPCYLLPGTYVRLVVFFWNVSGQEILERIVWQLPDNDRRIQMHFPPPPCWSLAVDSADGVCCGLDPHFHSKES